MSDALQLATDADLRALASALRRGELISPFENEGLLARYCPRELTAHVAIAFRRLSSESFTPLQIARLLETIIETRVGRPELERLINLVWTGPEVAGQTHRETASVVRELFASATTTVLVATYAIHHGRDIFQPLADRMAAIPSMQVELLADLNGQTPQDFAIKFQRTIWPPDRAFPAVYYDPRSGAADQTTKASLHAKLVVTDSVHVFVTSANFTERAHLRNIEAGVLVESTRLAKKITENWRRLIASGHLLPLEFGQSSQS